VALVVVTRGCLFGRAEVSYRWGLCSLGWCVAIVMPISGPAGVSLNALDLAM
jgi:hypothetical protein